MSEISWAILGGVVFGVLVRLEGPKTENSRLGPLGLVVMLVPGGWYAAQVWGARGSVVWAVFGFLLGCSAFHFSFWGTLRALATFAPGPRD